MMLRLIRLMDSGEAYVCHECLAIFLFKSDFEGHSEDTGHRNAAKIKVDAAVRLGDRDFLLFELQ